VELHHLPRLTHAGGSKFGAGTNFSRRSCVLAGVVLILLALVYWAEPAKSLPSLLPGHEAGSEHHHVKHGLAAFLLGIGAFVLAWFRTGPRRHETTA
jgi:hypothetical protein